ncbi:hypothetical protein [Methylobrevis pamukkalensis]|uniref:hypothetical protein n=1 Tax=Methylobrevis pamukkalensis TaxID=1439726 RepID=UPI000AA86378|nr:hypothetical protein [Methylobrevis pamukkalensis]
MPKIMAEHLPGNNRGLRAQRIDEAAIAEKRLFTGFALFVGIFAATLRTVTVAQAAPTGCLPRGTAAPRTSS